MRTAVIVLLGVLCCVQANDFELLQAMAEYEFGRTIIETIQIELQQGENSAGRVLDQLRQMKEATESEISDGVAQQKRQDEQCASQIEDVTNLLKDAQSKKADDERVVPLKEEALNDKAKQLLDKQGSEQRNQDKLQVLNQQRSADQNGYNSKRDEIQGLINTLAEAKATISQLASSNTFLQQPDQIKEKLAQHSKNLLTSTHGYVNLVQVLIETALNTKVQDDKKLVVAVLQVIDELVDSLHNLQSVEAKADSEKGQIFLLQKTRIESELTNLEGSLSKLKADKESLSQSLLELSNDISSKDRIAQAKSQQLADIQKTCVDQKRNGEKTTEQKNAELAIITQVIEIFDTRFTDAIRSYIQKMHIKE